MEQRKSSLVEGKEANLSELNIKRIQLSCVEFHEERLREIKSMRRRYLES